MGVCLKLGSKSDVFLIDGRTWLCSTGLPSDVIIEVGDISFRLHKFPLLSRSGVLEKLIEESCPLHEGSRHSILQLNEIPGGPKAFLLIAKFCYGVKFELNSSNIASLRCAAEFLQMTEDYGEDNLISQTERFLDEVLGNWVDSLRVLESCQDQDLLLLPWAEELQIISRCIDSMATKACADCTLFNWPVSSSTQVTTSTTTSSNDSVLWNGIRTGRFEPHLVVAGDGWWYQDVAHLKFTFYKGLIRALESKGMKADSVAGSVIYYAKKHLPITGRKTAVSKSTTGTTQSSASGSISTSPLFDPELRCLLEEIVDLLPDQKGVAPTKFLLRLLHTSMVLHAGPSCQENLEKRVGAQLDQASLEDLLITNMGYSAETLYDVDCIQRILENFLALEKDANNSSGEYASSTNIYCESINQQHLIMMGGGGGGGSRSASPVTRVANLIDGYLAEVAADVNLKLHKFQSLAGAVPDNARPLDDGIYRAIDIYLKAHPWLTDSEKEQVCRLMNCQKLSLEARTHAAQNQRLPLRVVVQVLFFEQLRLRTSIACCFFPSVSDNLAGTTSRNLNNNNCSSSLLGCSGRCESALFGSSLHHQEQIVAVDNDTKERVMELEKECMSMKQELEKLVKNKSSWNAVLRKLGLRLRSLSTDQRKQGNNNNKPLKVAAVAAAPPSPPPLPSSLPVKFVDDGDHIKACEGGEWIS